jgi:hypothetical protein
MVFKAPYCTDPSAVVLPPGKSPAKSPQEQAERTGKFLSFYFTDLRFTGPGCWYGEPFPFPSCQTAELPF